MFETFIYYFLFIVFFKLLSFGMYMLCTYIVSKKDDVGRFIGLVFMIVSLINSYSIIIAMILAWILKPVLF